MRLPEVAVESQVGSFRLHLPWTGTFPLFFDLADPGKGMGEGSAAGGVAETCQCYGRPMMSRQIPQLVGGDRTPICWHDTSAWSAAGSGAAV